MIIVGAILKMLNAPDFWIGLLSCNVYWLVSTTYEKQTK